MPLYCFAHLTQNAGFRMADRISPERRSANMARIQSQDTKPEMLVRRLLHGLGYRYRLHNHKMPGRPDIVFRGRRKVIFVHGCFWHQHESSACRQNRKPQSNGSYWTPKLERNVARDIGNRAALIEQGWDVLVVWECETKAAERLKLVLTQFLGATSQRP